MNNLKICQAFIDTVSWCGTNNCQINTTKILFDILKNNNIIEDITEEMVLKIKTAIKNKKN